MTLYSFKDAVSDDTLCDYSFPYKYVFGGVGLELTASRFSIAYVPSKSKSFNVPIAF